MLCEIYIPAYWMHSPLFWANKSLPTLRSTYNLCITLIHASLWIKGGLIFPIRSMNYFHRSSPPLSYFTAHSSGDGRFGKAGSLGLLLPEPDRTAVAKHMAACAFPFSAPDRLVDLFLLDIFASATLVVVCFPPLNSAGTQVLHPTPPFTLVEEVMWILLISEVIRWRGERSCNFQKSTWAKLDCKVLPGCYWLNWQTQITENPYLLPPLRDWKLARSHPVLLLSKVFWLFFLILETQARRC